MACNSTEKNSPEVAYSTLASFPEDLVVTGDLGRFTIMVGWDVLLIIADPLASSSAAAMVLA